MLIVVVGITIVMALTITNASATCNCDYSVSCSSLCYYHHVFLGSLVRVGMAATFPLALRFRGLLSAGFWIRRARSHEEGGDHGSDDHGP